jgi:flagellar basal body-associated protein FliL
MFGILDLISGGYSYLAGVVTGAPATGDQAMKLIVPMIALIIVAVVMVAIVIYMSNKDKNKKKKNSRNVGNFDDSDFK